MKLLIYCVFSNFRSRCSYFIWKWQVIFLVSVILRNTDWIKREKKISDEKIMTISDGKIKWQEKMNDQFFSSELKDLWPKPDISPGVLCHENELSNVSGKNFSFPETYFPIQAQTRRHLFVIIRNCSVKDHEWMSCLTQFFWCLNQIFV